MEKNITFFNVRKYTCPDRYKNWKKFEDYVDDIFMYRVKYSTDNLVMDFTCTCGNFMKKYLCVHVLGLGNLLNMLSFPRKAISTGLTDKRGPGRPKKMSKALEFC